MSGKLHELVKADGSHYAWSFHCPGCKALHQCDSRWTFNGSETAPTFRASVLVYEMPAIGRPRCHSFVTDGKIEFMSDSTHALAGKTVEIPDWDDRYPFGAPDTND